MLFVTGNFPSLQCLNFSTLETLPPIDLLHQVSSHVVDISSSSQNSLVAVSQRQLLTPITPRRLPSSGGRNQNLPPVVTVIDVSSCADEGGNATAVLPSSTSSCHRRHEFREASHLQLEISGLACLDSRLVVGMNRRRLDHSNRVDLSVWDCDAGVKIERLDCVVDTSFVLGSFGVCCEWSFDEVILAGKTEFRNEYLAVLNVRKRRRIPSAVFRARIEGRRHSSISGLAMDSTRRLVFSSSTSQRLRMWSYDQEAVVQSARLPMPGMPNCLRLDETNGLLFVGLSGGSLEIWDPRKLTNRVHAIGFSFGIGGIGGLSQVMGNELAVVGSSVLAENVAVVNATTGKIQRKSTVFAGTNCLGCLAWQKLDELSPVEEWKRVLFSLGELHEEGGERKGSTSCWNRRIRLAETELVFSLFFLS